MLEVSIFGRNELNDIRHLLVMQYLAVFIERNAVEQNQVHQSDFIKAELVFN